MNHYLIVAWLAFKHGVNYCWFSLVYRILFPIRILDISVYCNEVLVNQFDPKVYTTYKCIHGKPFYTLCIDAWKEKNQTVLVSCQFGKCSKGYRFTNEMIIPSHGFYKARRLIE